MMPACGPPSSLSPLNSTRSAPAAMLSRGQRLAREAEAGEVQQRAAADVVDHRKAVLAAQGDQFGQRHRLR